MYGFVYYIMTFMMALFTALVFFFDRIYSRRLKGIMATFVLPSAFVLMDYISVMTNPGETNRGGGDHAILIAAVAADFHNRNLGNYIYHLLDGIPDQLAAGK